MPTSRCTINARYVPADNDLLLLPFVNRKTPCFEPEQLPALPSKVTAPADKGGRRVVFAGRIGRARVIAQAIRLDKEHSTARACMSAAVAEALAEARKQKCARVVIVLHGRDADPVLAAQEGALLGGYKFDKYLSKKAKRIPVALMVKTVNPGLRKKLRENPLVFACVNFARDILNEPASSINPPTLAREFRRMGKSSGLRVTVWDEKRLAREGCGAILGVGQGASAKPRLVIGEYRPAGAGKHLCLVGKGVTFDTGGYCLKPSASQVGMKYDMGGAAMMFGAACAIARLRIPIRVTVLTPLAENDISGTAYHTCDVLKTRSGKTVEIGNTDAEGRLILADALALAVERKPDWIIDSATLTGACVVALGLDIAGVYGTDAKFVEKLLLAGEAVNEKYWEMPLHMPYLEQLKSTIADTRNTGGKWNGSITGAVFLKQWVPDNVKWLHCDIAGPAIREEPAGHLGKGAKGFGVKSMVELARGLA